MRKIIRILLIRHIIKDFIRYVIGISYGNNDSVRNTNQFIIAGNHNSHLDVLTILSAMPYEKLENTHPVAAADYFGKYKIVSFLIKYLMNATLIKRNKDTDGENPITQMQNLLTAGKSIIIFPEGSRGNAEELQKFKKGIGILLENNPHIPFIPVYLDGLGRALPKGDGLLVPFNGSIRFGEAKLKKENMSIDETVNYVEESVLELAPNFKRDNHE